MHAVVDTLAFRRFELDRRRRLLFGDGRQVELQSRAFDMLVCLIDRRDRVVSRDDIIAEVWSGLAVGQNNLTVQMSALRHALAEHGGEGLIITVPGRGYRFIGELTEVKPATTDHAHGPSAVQPPPDPTPATPILPPIARRKDVKRRRRILAAAIIAVAIIAAALVVRHRTAWLTPGPPRISIAVLRFRDLSDTPSHTYMADAITDDLTTDLSHIPDSTVIARESLDAFRNRPISASQIGEALGVRYLVEGSLRVEDDGIHVDASLVEAATGQQLWGERFAAPLEHLGETQTMIVRRIVSALDTSLTGIEGARALNDRPDDPDAEDMFFRARSLIDTDDTLDVFTQAQHLLEGAVRLQPTFADALAELGLVLVLKARSAADPSVQRDLAEARRVIAQALSLPQPNATALAVDARLHETDGDCAQAVQSAGAALELEPNSIGALSVLAKCAANSGRLEDAVRFELQVLRLNPESRRSRPSFLLLGQLRLLQGRYQEAADFVHRAIAGDAPPVPGADCMGRAEYARLLLIASSQLDGQAGQAASLYRDYAAIWPHRSVWRIAAFSPQVLSRSPGFIRFMTGLHDAGMPLVADEHADDYVRPLLTPQPPDDFAAVPTTLAGIATIDTAGLVSLLRRGPATVIDIGQGAAVIAAAAWMDRAASAQTEDAWIDDVLGRQPPTGQSAPVVVMGTGTYGNVSANAALHLAASGRGQVYWYRGGEEAWAAAGQPSTDHRLAY